jgi:phage/plasmid-like protein (TIGR03299 family)
MAHMVETMAYAGDVPWHGLGVSVSNDLTPQQMMQKAGLDWTVEKHDSFVIINDGFGGVKHVPTGQQALVRSSDKKVLTNVGEGWNPVQNEEAFNFFNEYVLAGDMEMHTAGSLKGGQMVWALAKVKESFDILGGDQVDSYLLFSNPHQYGKSIDVRFTPIRVVCNNTLSFSLDQKVANSVKMNHRSEFNPELVKQQMGIAHEKFAQYREMAEFLATKRFSMDSLIQYYNEVFPRTYVGKKGNNVQKFEDLTSNAKKAYELLEVQPGAKFGEGSWWQALNSVTYLTDHVMGRDVDTRLASAWYGVNQTRKIKAANKAVEYAMAA